jgi:hypothetical protein
MPCLLRFVLIPLFAAAFAASARAQTLDLAASTVVDLTHAFDSETIYWPTSPSGFELKPLHRGLTERGFFYAANAFCSPEHGGTHLDAPLHFAEGKWTSADIPAWEAAHGRIEDGTIVARATPLIAPPRSRCQNLPRASPAAKKRRPRSSRLGRSASPRLNISVSSIIDI